MKFSEFAGNRESVDRIKEQITLDRNFHAYILDGADGIGKKRLAYTMAQALLCENLQDGEPCEKCAACKKVMSENHGDIHYITTDGSSIKDEQIEAVQTVLMSKPFDGERTILLIDEADTMTPRAQNRLLKTLEEPQKGVVIFLLTKKISEILPTIVSRAAVIRLKPVGISEIAGFLERKYKYANKNEIMIAAGYSYGSPGKAVRLLEDEAFKARRERSINCACGLIEQKSLADFMNLIKDDMSNKIEIEDFIDMMVFWYRDILLLKTGMSETDIVNRDYLQTLKEFGSKVNLKKICRIIELIEDAKYDIIANVNINYVLKNMYLEIN